MRIVGSITHATLYNPSPDVAGYYQQQLRLDKPAGARTIRPIIVEDLGPAAVPEPLFMPQSALKCGSSKEVPKSLPGEPSFFDYQYKYMFTNAGTFDGAGANNVDKLVTVVGRVLTTGYDSQASQYYIVIDDGSHLPRRIDDTQGLGGVDGWGLKILTGYRDYGPDGENCAPSPAASPKPDWSDPCWSLNCLAICTGFVDVTLVMDWSDPDVKKVWPHNILASKTGNGSECTITWQTNVPADGRIDYCVSPGSCMGPVYTHSVLETGGLKTSHSVALTDLNPASVYCYQIKSSAPGWETGYSFGCYFGAGNFGQWSCGDPPPVLNWPKAVMNYPGFRVRMINGEPDIIMLP